MESDPPHRDMLQSYRGDGSFTSVDNDVVRGNVFIARIGTRYTLVPFQVGSFYTIDGIALYDGPYSNWVIENNVVMVEVGLGTALYGVSNSTIVNNTIIPDPLGTTTSGIRITDQKGGVATSNDDILRNNLMSWSDLGDATNLQQGNNIVASDYTDYFANYSGYDLHLKAGSPAINAGTTTNAPNIDADEAPRTAPYDVGAYEFRSLTGSAGDGFHATALTPTETGTFTATFDATLSASPEKLARRPLPVAPRPRTRISVVHRALQPDLYRRHRRLQRDGLCRRRDHPLLRRRILPFPDGGEPSGQDLFALCHRPPAAPN